MSSHLRKYAVEGPGRVSGVSDFLVSLGGLMRWWIIIVDKCLVLEVFG